MIAGIITGLAFPESGAALKPLSDAFIKLLKMIVGPIVFVTVVTGIARLGDIGRIGRIGGKAIAYFLMLTTLALVTGLIVGNVFQPGQGLDIDPASFNADTAAPYLAKAEATTATDYILAIIPDTLPSAFTSGNLLQVLLISLLFGIALSGFGAAAASAIAALELLGKILLRILGWIMWTAPVAVFAAMAFTASSMGPSALVGLFALMLCFYLTCGLFIIVVLGSVSAAAGFNIFRVIRYIRAELLTAFGTASSESVLAPIMTKLEKLGAAREVVGLVIPSGYSFNMDGNAIYLTLAILFLAQALNIPLSLEEQLSMLGVALLTSKGSSGVAGSGFVVLAATLAATGTVPVTAIVLLLGVDRFMSEARVITNLIGNTVATLVIAAWEGELDRDELRRELGL